MGRFAINLVYGLFFLSGVAALGYEIVWTRYLSLIFGGSHLAVTTVLTVFMAGLALGSYLIGTRIDGRRCLLRLFGTLELGIGASAIVFAGLIAIYPPIYVKLAQMVPENAAYLTIIRIAFAVIALIVPATLMGGTLPVLAAFSARVAKGAGVRLSFLYGCNTLGAVCGAAATGFFMLRTFSVGRTMATAIAINCLVGMTALILQRYVSLAAVEDSPAEEILADSGDSAIETLPLRLAVVGAGVSGFCAMGYEVLWNRILSIAIGASAYGFTLLLMAFLSGIGLGSAAFGILGRIRLLTRRNPFPLRSLVISFGVVQITIGAAALMASMQFGHIPTYVTVLHDFFLNRLPRADQFQAMQLANFILAFSLMFVPAFFMGVAFPLAGEINCRYRRRIGSATGELLSCNTVGAIFGAAATGFFMIYCFGIQPSLQLLILINLGYGMLVMAATSRRKIVLPVAVVAFLALLLLPAMATTRWRLWDPKLYAIYQSNKPEEFSTGDDVRDMLINQDVRYYAEGAQSIVSAIRSTDTLYFITNGRVEASDAHQDMQCQYVLGHLPMLLHKNPRQAFVLGTGSGMTLGAVSVHPSIEKITLAEIEPGVLGVARSFGISNHFILNKPDPRLKVVFNDGRNHLLTTAETYDIITADPVHPWFSGAGYLYSTEYFRLAASKLNPGGILCQWLPLYELTPADLKSVVRTIQENFAYTMIWVTHYDAEIVASNSPLQIDEEDLDRRIAAVDVRTDLRQVGMGNAEHFLSYYVMGSEGAKRFAQGGRINTDDNLYLEFSAPRSIGLEYLRGSNLAELLKYREPIFPYLRPLMTSEGRAQQRRRWESNHQAALLQDRAHVLDVSGHSLSYEFAELAAQLEDRYPRYAPWRFTHDESSEKSSGASTLLQEQGLALTGERGEPMQAQFQAILVRSDERYARVFFVDDTTRTVFGKLRVRGAGRDRYISSFARDVLKEVRQIYAAEVAAANAAGKPAPSLLTVFPKLKTMIESRIDAD